MTKHLRYASYLARHKWFVFLAGLKTGAPIWRLIIHDWSKFMPCEWLPYAEYFYGQKNQIAFDRAWLHHQHLNPHHWQHWVLNEDCGDLKCLPIPEHFVREMVADWAGAGRAITGSWDILPWYNKNRGKIQMCFSSRETVEKLLENFG